jgi:hypothetical protein
MVGVVTLSDVVKLVYYDAQLSWNTMISWIKSAE